MPPNGGWKSIMLQPIALACLIAAGPVPSPTPQPGATPVVAGSEAAPSARQRERRDSRSDESDRLTRTFKVGADGVLDLSNISGDIRVGPGPAGEIRIEAIRRARSRSEIETVRVEMAERGNRVEVRTQHTGRNSRASVDYIVAVPPAASVQLRSISGDVDLRDLRGEVRAETVSGDISAASVARAALKTVSGDLDIDSGESDGDLSATSVSGDVIVRGVKGRSLEVSTVSGDAEVRDVMAERVSVRTISGELGFSGPLRPTGRYEFQSHSGGIQLMLTETTGFELAAQTFSGNIRSDFPITLQGATSDTGRGRRGRALRGVHGDGSAFLEVTTFSGSIVVGRR